MLRTSLAFIDAFFRVNTLAGNGEQRHASQVFESSCKCHQGTVDLLQV